MLFMVIERYKHGDAKLVGERFKQKGRMLPEGVVYHASWMTPDGATCYQLMEAPNRESLNEWTSKWDDLVEFEIVPVVTSAEFWKER
ncbi:MAG: DUF3303 family protein [Candidatus Acidiferrales bacterium]